MPFPPDKPIMPRGWALGLTWQLPEFDRISNYKDKMLEEISILKPKLVAIQTQLGDFDQRTMLKQIELWGSKIIPAIRKEIGQENLTAA